MVFLSFVYRFVTNFAFMAMVYFSLNFMEKYQNRAILAILVLVYAGMRAASTLRAFYFFQKIEKLEAEAKRLQAPINDGSGATNARKQVVATLAAAPRRRAQVLYGPVLPGADRAALCRQHHAPVELTARASSGWRRGSDASRNSAVWRPWAPCSWGQCSWGRCP